jgi:glycine/D-amino acid oxidase-like deaminating enzyme
MSDPSKSNDVIVIGAGIVGVCCALEAQRDGHTVTLIDRLPPGEGCSFGNAGVLGAQGVVPIGLPGLIKDVPKMLLDPLGPLVIRRRGFLNRTLPWLWRFYRASRPESVRGISAAMRSLHTTTVELHKKLAAEAGVSELINDHSYLVLMRSAPPPDLDTTPWRLRREAGARVEVFEGDAIRELEPAVSSIYKTAVRYGPMGTTANPFRLTQSYANLFRQRGGTILQEEVVALKPLGATTTVETRTASHRAKSVVVAAGAWSARLVEPLGHRLPLIAERGYHITFANPGITLSHSLHEASRHVAITPMEHGLRIAGTDELGDPDDTPLWQRADTLKQVVEEALPGANTTEGSRWMGPRPSMPDSLPAIGPIKGHPNIFLACGHGHLGLTAGPETGRIIASLVRGQAPNIDVQPYNPSRFM